VFKRDKVLTALGITNVVLGIVWGVALEVYIATPGYAVSAVSIFAGLVQATSGFLLLYQKGKGIYYGVIATAVVAGIAYLFTPYWDDLIIMAFCYAVVMITFLRRKSFEMAPVMEKLLSIVSSHGQIDISDLAMQLGTTEANIELAVIELQSKEQPIKFDKNSRKVFYDTSA
jgi:hypothetical protein